MLVQPAIEGDTYAPGWHERAGRCHNDLIYLNGDEESVSAGAGHDHIWGLGATVVHIDGEDGNDLIVGSPGNDVLSGGEGVDMILGAEGDDTIGTVASPPEMPLQFRAL